MNWITRFIKPKLKSLFKKKSAEREDGLWQTCTCSKLTLKEDFEKNLFVTGLLLANDSTGNFFR